VRLNADELGVLEENSKQVCYVHRGVEAASDGPHGL
jgi:hypothetical protein